MANDETEDFREEGVGLDAPLLSHQHQPLSPLLDSAREDAAASLAESTLLSADDERRLDDDDDDGGDHQQQPSGGSLHLFRFLYFLNGLSASTWGRFGVIYYNQVVHLSPLQIGFLQSIFPLLSLIFMPVWGYVADAIVHSRKQVYLFCKICGTLSLLSLNFVPTTPTSEDDDGTLPAPTTPSSSKRSFFYVAICVGLMATFRASGVLDAHLMDSLQQRGQRSRYGTIRMWSSMSWGLGAIMMGYITDAFGFQYNFILYGGMMVPLCWATAVGLPARSPAEAKRYERHHRQTSSSSEEIESSNGGGAPELRTLWQALFHPQVVFWLFQVVTIGAGMALVDSFLFVYLQNELGASTRLCGQTVGVTVLCGLPLFYNSEALLHRVGHDRMFVAAMMAYIVRAFGYTILTPATVHWVLLLEILHGITFACTWIASMDYCARVSPPEWSTTVQAIMSASFSCLGPVVGSMLGGWIMERYHTAVVVYRWMAGILLVVLVLHVLISFGFQRGHDRYLKLLDDVRESDDTREPVDEESLSNEAAD